MPKAKKDLKNLGALEKHELSQVSLAPTLHTSATYCLLSELHMGWGKGVLTV
jgi:hypothetical protein